MIVTAGLKDEARRSKGRPDFDGSAGDDDSHYRESIRDGVDGSTFCIIMSLCTQAVAEITKGQLFRQRINVPNRLNESEHKVQGGGRETQGAGRVVLQLNGISSLAIRTLASRDE